MLRVWKRGQGEPRRILLWFTSNAICTFHWLSEGEEIHRMNMGGVFIITKRREMQEKSRWERTKRGKGSISEKWVYSCCFFSTSRVQIEHICWGRGGGFYSQQQRLWYFSRGFYYSEIESQELFRNRLLGMTAMRALVLQTLEEKDSF